MSDTTYVVTICKRAKGKEKQTIKKFETEKKARVFYEKERQALVQDSKWGDVLADSADFYYATNSASGIDHMGASVKLTTEVNFDYYVNKLIHMLIVSPDKVRKVVRTIYNKGYDRGWEQGCWEN